MIDVIVIGAGISGLLCATELQRAGLSVCVLDKGRAVGGRMATRYQGQARFDHGAQFFTVRERRFQRYVDAWQQAGVIQQWFQYGSNDSNADGYPRYCGRFGMTDVTKYLSDLLEVHTSQTVVELKRVRGHWELRTASNKMFRCHSLIITAPVPQALSLLDTTGLDYAGAELPVLRSIRYARGLAILAILNGPSGLSNYGAYQVADPIINWIADNQLKGISTESAITIHASAAFADDYWDAPDDTSSRMMLDAAAPYLLSTIREFSCHRWGFTLPLNPYPQWYFHNPDINLILAGDGFGGPRVESAALSGLSASDALLETLLST
jgi:predicted NAD/FAD-dependent oxidoreductase